MNKRLLSLLILVLAVMMPMKMWAQEPYAVLSDNNTVLTFYYDDQKEARNGMSVGPFNYTSDRGWYAECANITEVVIDTTMGSYTGLTVTDYWFDGFTNLTNIRGLEILQMENVTSTHSMFYGCSNITSLDLSTWNTESFVNIGSMFSDCSSLKEVNLAGWNVAKVTYLSNMFINCSSLVTIYADSSWALDESGRVTGWQHVFDGCEFLVGGRGTTYNPDHTDSGYAHIDGGPSNPGYLSDKNAPMITNPEHYAVLSDNNTVLTFYYDAQKEQRNGMGIGPFPASTSVRWDGHQADIKKVVFDSSFDAYTGLTSTRNWFRGCNAMTTITGIEYLHTDNVTDMDYMFYNCISLEALDVSHFNTANVTNMFSLFYNCSLLPVIDVSGFNTSKVVHFGNLFYGCSSVTSLDVSHFDTSASTSTSYMFAGCSKLTTLDVSGFNTANVTDMSRMFVNCSSLISLDLSNFNTSNVTNIQGMFSGCSSLAAIQAGNANIPAEEYARIQNPNLLVYVNNVSLAPQGVQNVVVNGVAQEIVLTDVESGNNNFFVPQSFTAGKVSYTRNFTQQTQPNVSRGWESISLPFNVQNIVHETKGALSPFGSSAEGKKFWLRRLADNGLTRATQIVANVPYVISMPNSTEYTDLYNLSGRVTFSSQNTTVPATTPEVLALADSSIVMMPTTLRVNRSSSVWAINVGEVRGQYLEGSVFERDYREVRPFEAYTVHRSNSPAPRFVPISEIGGTTGIGASPVNSEEVNSEKWYDLNGRQLQEKPTQKGVYLNGGRKVVVVH